MTEAMTIASPWTPYGLRDDPYFQQALEPVLDPKAGRPATLHVGRAENLREIASQIVGNSSSRAIIQGAAGVGKTSLVSRIKATLTTHGVLSHTDPVRVQGRMSARDFLGEVLRVLLLIRATDLSQQPATSARKAWIGGKPGEKSEAAASRGWKTSKAEEAFWVRVSRIIEGEDSLAGGLTVGTVGAQHERIRIQGELPNLSLFRELQQALMYLSHDGARRILIHVNNMERLSVESIASARVMMGDLRDAFLFMHGHWLFVGATGIEHTVFGEDAVESIMTLSVTLAPLSPDEVVDLLQRRYKHLQQGIHLTPPVSDEAARTLYARYQGQLRGFLKLLSRAVQRRAVLGAVRPLSTTDVVRLLADEYWARSMQGATLNQVTATNLEHLRTLLAAKPFDTEFRATDIAKSAELTPAAASHIIEQLSRHGVIGLVRTKGRSKYYRITDGDLTVALRME